MREQHTEPCRECPLRRKSAPGWLGEENNPKDWIAILHSDKRMECHLKPQSQCAGAAIYRRNVCKRVSDGVLVLPKDPVNVFATPMEFTKHHTLP